MSTSAWDKQVGGEHYKKYKLQPMEYSMQNKLDPLQHTIIKYVTRFRDKGTPIVDLTKSRHCIDMLMEHEGGEPTPSLVNLIEKKVESLTRQRDQLFALGNDYIGEKTITDLLRSYEMVLKDVQS